MAIDVQASLAKQRVNILAELLALAIKDRPSSEADHYRREGQGLLKAFEDTEKAIAAVGPVKGLDLARCESAIDAIEMLLKSEQVPMRRSDLIAGVIEGGLWGAKDGTALRVRKSLTMHLKDNPESKMHGRIKELRGLVGLFQWADDRWFQV